MWCKNLAGGVRILRDKYAHFLPNELDRENLGTGELGHPTSEVIRGLWKLVISLNEKVDVILAQMDRKEDFEYISKASGRNQSEC
jgi:hypothetical protein